MSSLWQIIIICMDVPQTQPFISLKMSIIISLVGTLTQARMGIGRVTFLSKGPTRGQ